MSVSLMLWALLCVVCFVAGLVWSWRHWRRRLQQRMTRIIDEEVRRQLARELLRQLQEGPSSR